MARTHNCAEPGDVAHTLHQLNAIFADAEIEARDLAEMLVHERRIFFLDGHAGSDRAATDAEVLQVIRGLLNAAKAAADRAGVRRKFLAESNRHRVLEVGPPSFDDVVESCPSRRASRRFSNALTSPSTCDEPTGCWWIVSLVDCAMLTWSFSCTGV
jgi:hypothetical protein